MEKIYEGMKLLVRDKAWYDSHAMRNPGGIGCDHRFSFSKAMASFCGRVATVTYIIGDDPCILIDLDYGMYVWELWMFEEEVNPLPNPEPGAAFSSEGELTLEGVKQVLQLIAPKGSVEITHDIVSKDDYGFICRLPTTKYHGRVIEVE